MEFPLAPLFNCCYLLNFTFFSLGCMVWKLYFVLNYVKKKIDAIEIFNIIMKILFNFLTLCWHILHLMLNNLTFILTNNYFMYIYKKEMIISFYFLFVSLQHFYAEGFFLMPKRAAILKKANYFSIVLILCLC